MADDDLEVVLEPDAVVVEPEKKEPEVEAKTVVTPEEGIDTLKAALVSETVRREAAERIAAAATASATEAHEGKAESDLALVSNAIETINGQQDLLEGNMAAAAAAGDWAEHSKFQRQMSDNAAKLLKLADGKDALEAAAKEPKVTPLNDPVEALALQLTPASAAWVRSHPEFARDPAKYQQMIGADSLARGRGIAADTPAYFTAVEEMLGVRAKAPATVAEPEIDPISEAGRTTDRPPAAAPARRENNGASRVTLTAAQREAAADNNMTPEEYAKELLALKAEGRMQ